MKIVLNHSKRWFLSHSQATLPLDKVLCNLTVTSNMKSLFQEGSGRVNGGYNLASVGVELPRVLTHVSVTCQLYKYFTWLMGTLHPVADTSNERNESHLWIREWRKYLNAVIRKKKLHFLLQTFRVLFFLLSPFTFTSKSIRATVWKASLLYCPQIENVIWHLVSVQNSL